MNSKVSEGRLRTVWRAPVEGYVADRCEHVEFPGPSKSLIHLKDVSQMMYCANQSCVLSGL